MKSIHHTTVYMFVEVLGEPAEMNKQTKHEAKCRTAKKIRWPEFIWTANHECELLLNMMH